MDDEHILGDDMVARAKYGNPSVINTSYDQRPWPRLLVAMSSILMDLVIFS